jgi:hypothetical protein
MTKLTMLLLLLLPSLGCSFATFNNTERSNFVSSTTGLNNSLEQTRPRGLYATTKDGRTVLLKEGTWEFATNPLGSNATATLPNGQVVLLRSDGSWIYQGPSPGKLKRKRLPPLAPASFLHIYQLGGGRGRATIFLNGAPIAALREKRYFVIRVTPGTHVLNIFNPTKGRFVISATNRRHFYLRNSDTQAWWGERLQMVDAITGKAEISSLKPLNGTDVFVPNIFLEPQMSSSN